MEDGLARLLNPLPEALDQYELADSLLDQFRHLDRTPNGLLTALRAVEHADRHSTAAIFLGQSKLAWLVYHVNKVATERLTHFTGKAQLSRKVAFLEAQPVAYQIDLAKKLAPMAEDHVYVKRKADRWWKGVENMRKRERLRRDSPLEVRDRRSSSPPHSLDEAAQARELSPTQAFPNALVSFADLECVRRKASLQETLKLFPEILSDSIKRIPQPGDTDTMLAGVSMTFADARNNIECQMRVEIEEHKIDNLARDLFDVRLQASSGLRYVCLPGGAKIWPDPNLILRGCQYDAISTIFGPEVTAAVRAGHVYLDDLKQLRSRTGSVWMVISSQASADAELCLSMGPVEGRILHDKIF